MTDPFPQVAGQGAERLRQAGITVDIGIKEKEARQLNAPYLKLLRTGRPYVHAKWAMTLDGKIATRTGDSRWITSDVARHRVHDLRGRMDAIIVGIGTVLADDPRLTVRPPGPRVPTRIILDSGGRLPKNCNLLKTLLEAPLLVVTTTFIPELNDIGCATLRLAAGESGRPDVLALLDELGRRKMTNVLVEGGAEVLGSFFDAKAIDEVHVFIAPRIAGGKELVAVAGRGVEKIADAWSLLEWEVEQLGPDVLLHGIVRLA
jgi:diaminohydroxyphosphoribosylaminopyrimidine deaminase/5-amino-6-(5-phosphoribosylamino)uracil reductase